MKREVVITGTIREYTWGTAIQKRKRSNITLPNRVLSREDAERVFASRSFDQFRGGVRNEKAF